MNTRQLQYFLEIAQKKNMNKATDSLYVAQSALSQYLSRLEKEMGVPLFYRKKGNLTLTPAGVIYQEYAQKILQLEKEMTQKINASASVSRIRVGVNSVWSNLLVASITPKFRRLCPDASIELFDLNHKVLKRMITDGSIDLAVISTDSLDFLPGYTKILRMEEIMFAVSRSNPYICRNPELPDTLTFPDLMEHFGHEQFILTKSDSSFRPLMNSTFAAYGFHPDVVCEVSNMTTICNMVEHNIGVAFIPQSIMASNPGLDIACFSIEPGLTRINGLICRETLGFTTEEKCLIELIENYPLFQG